MRLVSADLGLEALAKRFGVPADFARTADARGLIPRDDDGMAGPAATRRLRLIGFALRRGIEGTRLLDVLDSSPPDGDVLEPTGVRFDAVPERVRPHTVAAVVRVEPVRGELRRHRLPTL